MLAIDRRHWQVGSDWPPVVQGPITREMLVAYAQASGDDNPVHLDADYARLQAGMSDVFAHGMLSAAWLARLLTGWVDPTAIRQLSVRFVAVMQLGDQAHCHARVVEQLIKDGQRCVRLHLQVLNQTGAPRLTGSALVVVPLDTKDVQ